MSAAPSSDAAVSVLGSASSASDPLAELHAASWRFLRALAADHLGMPEALARAVLFIGPTGRGWAHFSPDRWVCRGAFVDEIAVNAHLLDQGLEELIDSLAHEAVHAWCRTLNIRDTSRGGRYHNRQFAIACHLVGLRTASDKTIGTRTVGPERWLLAKHHNAVAELDEALVLVRRSPLTITADASAGGTSLPASDARYVFARCNCRIGRGHRTIRVAAGSWEPDIFTCELCGSRFEQSPTT